MSLSIYTYSNPYEIHNEPYWDSIKNCAHFCVSQTMVNGLVAVYSELDCGQIATIEELVEALYPNWFDTKTYISQYTALTNVLDNVKVNVPPEEWKRIKQSLSFKLVREISHNAHCIRHQQKYSVRNLLHAAVKSKYCTA